LPAKIYTQWLILCLVLQTEWAVLQSGKLGSSVMASGEDKTSFLWSPVTLCPNYKKLLKN